MQKRRRQIAAWWESLDTECDNLRVNPQLFKSLPESQSSAFPLSSDSNEKLNPDSCYIIKEALQKLSQFLSVSHQEGCLDKACKYDPKTCLLKVTIKKTRQKEPSVPGEFKLRKKRGRKSKFELQQLALMRSANGTISL